MAFEVTSAKRSRLGRLSSFLNGKKRKQALNIQNRPLVGRIIRDAPIEPLRPKSLFQPIETIGPTSNHSTQVGRALRARLVEALRVQFSTQPASEMPPLPKAASRGAESTFLYAVDLKPKACPANAGQNWKSYSPPPPAAGALRSSSAKRVRSVVGLAALARVGASWD